MGGPVSREVRPTPTRRERTGQGRHVNWDDPLVESAATDTGMRRSNNQDSHVIVRAPHAEAWKRRGHLFIVADGMGAHAVGELASKLACDNIPHNYFKSKEGPPAEALTKAFQQVGAQIHGKAAANKDFAGMGTTCSALRLGADGALIAHVGDSRIYRIRAGKIEQLTFDHSLAWELVRRNHMDPEQAAKVVPRNVITRSLGPDPQVEVDVEGPLPVLPGDAYLLCSDGLSGPVEDPELGAFVAHFHPEAATRYVLHLANLRGGHDNITVLVVHVGAWKEPGTEVEEEAEAAHKIGWGARLGGLIGSKLRRPAAVVEENIYRSAECTIDPHLLDSLSEQVHRAEATAIEKGWPVDRPVLANLRRESEEARTAGDTRGALRCLGEAISMLGVGGRLHRKSQSGSGARPAGTSGH